MTIKEAGALQSRLQRSNDRIAELQNALRTAGGELRPLGFFPITNFKNLAENAVKAEKLVDELEQELAGAKTRRPATASPTASPAAAAAHKPIHVNVPAHHLRSKAAAPPAGPDLATLEKLAGQIFNGAWRSHRYDELDEAGKMAFLRKEFFQAHIEIPGGITDGEAKERKIWRTAELTGLPKAVRHARQEVADKFFQNKNHEGA